MPADTMRLRMTRWRTRAIKQISACARMRSGQPMLNGRSVEIELQHPEPTHNVCQRFATLDDTHSTEACGTMPWSSRRT